MLKKKEKRKKWQKHKITKTLTKIKIKKGNFKLRKLSYDILIKHYKVKIIYFLNET